MGCHRPWTKKCINKKTRGDIVGYSDDKQGDDEQNTDEEDDIRDSIDDIKPKGEDMEMEIEEYTSIFQLEKNQNFWPSYDPNFTHFWPFFDHFQLQRT